MIGKKCSKLPTLYNSEPTHVEEPLFNRSWRTAEPHAPRETICTVVSPAHVGSENDRAENMRGDPVSGCAAGIVSYLPEIWHSCIFVSSWCLPLSFPQVQSLRMTRFGKAVVLKIGAHPLGTRLTSESKTDSRADRPTTTTGDNERQQRRFPGVMSAYPWLPRGSKRASASLFRSSTLPHLHQRAACEASSQAALFCSPCSPPARGQQ
jgi:hypothetical protein